MKYFKFPEHELAHKYLDKMCGIEIGASSHNPFNLPNCRNVDYTDSLDTIYKQEEARICGEVALVDIVAPGDNLPLSDNSVDYVISSHVFEHFANPIKALLEWCRVIRDCGLIFIIVPKPDALPQDRGCPTTTLDHFYHDMVERKTEETHEIPIGGGHYHIWSYESFYLFMNTFSRALWHATGARLVFVAGEETDTKVGNGSTHVYKLLKNQNTSISSDLIIPFNRV